MEQKADQDFMVNKVWTVDAPAGQILYDFTNIATENVNIPARRSHSPPAFGVTRDYSNNK
jgi:hypothetical protein